MSTNSTLRNVNKLIDDKRKILEAFTNCSSLEMLHFINRHNRVTNYDIVKKLGLSEFEGNKILSGLEDAGLVTRSNKYISLSLNARKRISYSLFSFDFLVGATITVDRNIPHPLGNSYTIEKRIGKGATSYTFHAIQSGTHQDRTLKIFLPNTITYYNLEAALKKRAKIKTRHFLPGIIEIGQVRIKLPNGKKEIFSAVVLNYIDSGARTFSEFLKAQQNFNPLIFKLFIEQVGGALAAIEEIGLTHGDLHDGNILVVPGASNAVAHEFWVIDFIGVPSTSSQEIEILSDLENFRSHLLRAAIIACNKYPGYSARFVLGEQVFRVLENLRQDKYLRFRELLNDFEKPKIDIPNDHFRTPAPEPFEWLRVEWILDAQWLYKLFEPVPSRFETINRFGNTWISGPRGCGKSHYLRVLAFNADVINQANRDQDLADKLQELDYNHKKAFGILFACRLGEFKSFSPEATGSTTFNLETQEYLKHILVLKIWNKTLYTIMEGLRIKDHTGMQIIESPQRLQQFLNYLGERLGPMTVVEADDSVSTFWQCLSMCVARENSAITAWHTPTLRSKGRLLNESDLDSFFAVLKNTFQDLKETRFYILVDDASFGNMHIEMQKILNSLIRAAQANHCFKLTCDKYSYTLDTMDGRSIDPRNEVTYVDLGEISTKSQFRSALNLSNYMMKVVDRRLKAACFDRSILELLGNSQDAREFLTALSIPGARRPKKGSKSVVRTPRPKAYYAGWNIIWHISHGSVRTLLELIEYIFKSNKVNSHTNSITLKDQDEAVRSYSNRHFKALSMLPGECDGDPLGQRLQGIISAIGEISRQYLERYNTGDDKRWYETISIERLDRKVISQKTHNLLFHLVNHGLFLDEGVTFSRAQFGLCQRYDMNKIFAPAFETTYRVRNHIFLSKSRLEELLLAPENFVKRHRKKLSDLTSKNQREEQVSLFKEND